jgi:hypothetical protein
LLQVLQLVIGHCKTHIPPLKIYVFAHRVQVPLLGLQVVQLATGQTQEEPVKFKPEGQTQALLLLIMKVDGHEHEVAFVTLLVTTV